MEIKKGDRFLCIEDVIMDNDAIDYIKGRIYLSEKDDCITDEDGFTNHEWLGEEPEKNFKPIYTIKDLSEGRVAVLNDGTLEEVWEVLCVAFPKDSVCSGDTFENFCFDFKDASNFSAREDDDDWTWDCEQNLPTQTVKVFLQELRELAKEPNIISDWLEKEGSPEIQKEVEQKLIRRFTTGAVRSNDAGRIRPDWVSPYAIEEISKVLVNNSNDFGGGNYLLGIPEEECLASLQRHVLELQEALLVTKDTEQAKIIARSVGFNVVAMLHTMVMKEKGLYKEIFEKTQLVTVEEAKKANEFIKS